MHLWPSLKLRDSFKLGYLNNLEWNIRRMKSQKNTNNECSGTSNNEQKLLTDNTEDSQNCNNKNWFLSCVSTVVRDILMICSCCYCCGACID